MRRLIIAVGVVLGCWRCAFGLDATLDINQYAHTVWRNSEGFAKSQILSIAQTPDGYLWLGTKFGLLRFDGVRKVPWQAPEGTSLPDSHVRSLLGARDGTLWIGTWAGLASWKGNSLTSYPQLSGWFINALLQDRQGIVWASAQALTNPFSRLCSIGNRGVQCVGDDGRFGRWITSLHQDGQGTLWVQAATGLWHWRPGAPEVHPIASNNTAFEGITDGDSGDVLIITKGGITGVTDKGKTSPFAALPGYQAKLLLRDRDGGLWVGSHDSGLLHVHHGRTDAFRTPDGLSSENIQQILEDREGDIWVSTDAGLDRFRDVIAPTYSIRQGLSSDLVASVLGSQDGSVWISTSRGLNRWRTGEFTMYADVRERPSDAPTLPGTQPSSVRNIVVKGLPRGGASLFEDRSGRLWVGAAGSVGYLENERYVTVSKANVFPTLVDAITEDKIGNVWFINSTFGLTRVSPNRDVQRYSWQQLHLGGAASCLAADPRTDGLWLGLATGGVVQLVDGRVRASYSASSGLAKGRISDLRVDPDGALWVGAQGGLSRLQSGRIATLDSGSGLPCDSVDWMIEDDTGAAWVKTVCGLAHIDRSDLASWEAAVDRGSGLEWKIHVTVIAESDGVRSGGMTYHPQVTKARDGRLWFYNVTGMGVVNPRELRRNPLPPPVHIEQLIADRKTYQNFTRLRLPPLVHELQIDYTALSLVAPETNQFRYKLDGHDLDWQDAGNRRQAFYNDLPPGTYGFHVIASNNSGVWNSQGDTLDFTIAPAYWQTNWFRALCALAILGLLWLGYLWRMRQLNYAFKMRLEARLGERMRIARDLHDTLLQSFQGLLLRFQTVAAMLPTRPEEAKEVVLSAVDQAAQAITDGRRAVQGLRGEADETSDFATELRTAGELAARETGNESVTFRVEVEGSRRKLHPLVRDEVYRIACEALRNAFRHAQARQIEVELEYQERQLRLRVRDDGQGVDPKILEGDGQTLHFGLHGMRERAKLIEGDLEVWSAPTKGTEVELRVPASRAYAAK